MKKEKISAILQQLDEKYVAEAADFTAEKPAAQPRLRYRRAIAAACIALAVALGAAGAFTAVAEAKEYRAALGFFEVNGLSAEGLTHGEVKKIYRDIQSRRFAYGKTQAVIRSAVPGAEIPQEEPTPEELAAVWDRYVWLRDRPQEGIWYRTEEKTVMNEILGYEVFDSSEITCLRGEKELWRAEIRDFYVENCKHTAAGTAVWGHTYTRSAQTRYYGWIALIDDNGALLWEKRLEHGKTRETVAAVAENPDGTWAVFSGCDSGEFCLTQIDPAGKELSSVKNEIGKLGIRNAVRLEDGYLLQVENKVLGETARLIKVDRAGNVLEDYTFEAEDCLYYLTDMAEYGGQVYLSAYAVPDQEDPGGRNEIANVLSTVFSRQGWEIGSEELTALLRENYTAVLLVCDPAEGAPKNFYSVRGSLGGALKTNEKGLLEWEVQSLTSSFFSPATSSFTIGGLCRIFRYSFGVNGALVQKTETEETVPYRR